MRRYHEFDQGLRIGSVKAIQTLCEEEDLLNNRDGVVRLPFLVKGRLVTPPGITRQQAEDAFRNIDRDTVYVRLPAGQILRQPLYDKERRELAGDYIYYIMPMIAAAELIETNIDKLVRELYALNVNEILSYLESIVAELTSNPGFVIKVMELYRLTTGFPEIILDNMLISISSYFSREAARQMIDNELSSWGKPGSEFLNGWVEIPVQPFSGSAVGILSSGITPVIKSSIRAMPTRQLHITAGNVPEVPLASIMRTVLTKSAATIKLPAGAMIPGALYSLAAAAVAPDHPLTRSLSVVYWPGGDTSIESQLFKAGSYDRIVVWGAPETVAAVQAQAKFTRTVFFNPRYGISLIGREAFSANLDDIAGRAVADVMIQNQQSCTASLVQYIEANDEQVKQFARHLQNRLAEWDNLANGFVMPPAIGQIKDLKRGRYSQADWYLNEKDGRYTSGVVVMRDEFDLLDHPLSRLVIIRPVADLHDVFRYLSQNVSTVGVFPESRRMELRDDIAARGVSDIFPLGECEKMYAGMPHDGMLVLSDLVDWKNA